MCSLDIKNNRKMCAVDKPEDTITFSSLLHYKVDIFLFLNLILISNYSTSERFLKIRRLVLVLYPYPLRGKFIFLKNYRSNVLVLMMIERFLKRRNLSPHFSPYPLRAKNIFYFLNHCFSKQ